MTPAIVGLDLAKNVFHVHVADPSGKMLESRKLARRDVLSFFRPLPSCLIGIEACATAHYWARELRALGHEVRLIPPGYVKPFADGGEPLRVCRRLQLLSRMEHHEQDDEQVFP